MTDKDLLPCILPEIDVSNIYIYVGDAVRDDYLSGEIATRGVHVRTIAASTHSPTSFASITTGLYPPRHGVSSFSNQLADDTSRLFDFEDIDTRFLNSIFEYAAEEHGHNVDPIYSVLNADIPEQEDPFNGLDAPFVVMERGPGGHAPYGDFDGTATEYFNQRSAFGTERIRRDYRRSIELDADLFSNRLATLEDRGLRDDTLVIYLSDHGELLGEGGMLGHNSPMRPELVYVPTVFIHPDLPNADVHDFPFHHVDIFPTVCDVLNIGEELASEKDGFSATKAEVRPPRPCFWENQFLPKKIPSVSDDLRYEGVWDSDGGRVLPDSALRDRLAVFSGKLFKSSKRTYMYRHAVAGIRSYIRGDYVYGHPSFDTKEANEILSECKRRDGNSQDISLSEDARNHLRDLGYMN